MYIPQMLLVTAQEMQTLDRLAMERYHVPSLTLMENAGRAVAEWILSEYRDRLTAASTIHLLCGLGNNGGDGFVCARYLAEKQLPVAVWIAGPSRRLRGDAKAMWAALKSCPTVHIHHVPLNSPWSTRAPHLKKTDLLVDALLGTGLARPVEGIFAEMIQWMNRSRLPVVSIDIPSGLSADTGKPLGVAVRAHSTVTFQLAKQGLLLYPGNDYTGKLQIADIGIPPLLIKQQHFMTHLTRRDDVAALLKPRVKESHKGAYGHALVVGGELGKIGAGLMAAKAFMRAGGGLASVALPEVSYERIDPHFLEAMYLPLPTATPCLHPRVLPALVKHLEKKSVCILGPGLGYTPYTQAFVEGFLKQAHLPIVLDADGLNCVARHLELLSYHRGRLVVTPHPGEMSRLTGLKTSAVQADRIKVAKQFAQEYGVYVVLKGYQTIIATPQGEIFINTTGNPGMATAGMGDVLSGVIASFIAQGYPMKQALVLGVYSHGLAGDRVCEEKGERGMLAQDVIEKLPYVLQGLTRERA